MRTRLLSLMWLSLVSHSAFAANSLAVLTPKTVLESSHQAEFYVCEEAPKVWCNDDWRYYRVSFFAQIQPELKPTQLQLLAPFSSHDYSQVQLNLRRDGFQLLRVAQGDNVFDVEQQIAGAENDAQLAEVDKALVLFLNRTLREDNVEQVWRNETWQARLLKQNDMIELHLSDQENK
ncbi:hypothetical protein [Vibrio intestinalis]|uniref:hypothetical protein n=1 Tax=Vibrio intestinalis TaxID=2933291 RepID=UPI0021A786A3|nr:hypothetical protein [Vibrio intestinalis]